MTHYDENDPTARVSRHEIEVVAGLEDVWQAIATGPGIGAWFVPAEVEGRAGGRIVTDHGPFGASEGVVTAWEPPYRFAYEERDWNPEAPEAPSWATELLVEAREGGTCVVRLVSGFFTDGEDWEEHLAGTDEGWEAAMANLKLYLDHFAGLSAANLLSIGTVPGERDAAVDVLVRSLGLDTVQVGDRVRLPDSAPATRGIVEEVDGHGVRLRTDLPSPGLLEFGVFEHGATTLVVRGYLYGERGQQIADREGASWTGWLQDHIEGFTEMR